MAKLRKVATNNAAFGEACMAAVLPVRELLVDLELPRAAKLSWWRLSGYNTRPSSDNEATGGEDESESDDESESESSDEE